MLTHKTRHLCVASVILTLVLTVGGCSDDPQPTTPLATTPSISPAERAAVKQWASDEAQNVDDITGGLETIRRLMDPPEPGNDEWLQNVRDKCKDIETDTSRGYKIEFPPRCRATQTAYAGYLSDVRYYAHWLPIAIQKESNSGVRDCNRHLDSALASLKQAQDQADALSAQMSQ